MEKNIIEDSTCKMYRLTGNCPKMDTCKLTHKAPLVAERKKLGLRAAEPFNPQQSSEVQNNSTSQSPEKKDAKDRPKLRANNTEFKMTDDAKNESPALDNPMYQMMLQNLRTNPNFDMEAFNKWPEPMQINYLNGLCMQQMQFTQMMGGNMGMQGGMNMAYGMQNNMQDLMAMMGMAEGDDDEEDDNEFVELCKDCDCCKGFPYICKSSDFCREMDQCYCIMQMETEQNIDEENKAFREDLKSCDCCHGYY